MTPEEVIIQAALDTAGEVIVPADLWNLNQQREKFAAAALKLTAEPIAIFTRTENFRPVFVIRRFDKNESVPYEEVKKEAIKKGWIPKIL